MEDSYRTIRSETRIETKVQGSRFIGIAIPVSNAGDAAEMLRGIRKEFYDATHHCYAYRFGMGGDQFRYNDDGEPSGTAGKPILSAIDRVEMTNVMVVVVRYFGGTKLGVGGLGRAYGNAAESALAAAAIVTRYCVDRLVLTFPHAQVHNVMHLISRLGARIEDTAYDEEVHLTVEVRKSLKDDLRDGLIDRTGGNIRIGEGTQ